MIYLVIIFVLIAILMFVYAYLLRRRIKNAGLLVILTTEDGKKLFSLELDQIPDDIESMKYVTFKVVHEATEEFE